MAAAGLALADLFAERLPSRGPLRPGLRRMPAMDALAVINREALLVGAVASDLRRHRDIDDATWERLAQAVARIGQAVDATR